MFDETVLIVWHAKLYTYMCTFAYSNHYFISRSDIFYFTRGGEGVRVCVTRGRDGVCSG